MCEKQGRYSLQSVNSGQPQSFVGFGKKTGLNGIGGEPAQFVAGEALLGMREKKFVGEIGAEEGGIVGVERDQQAAIEVFAEGMVSEGRADAGADVGGGVQFEGNVVRFQFFNESCILDGGKRVPNALGTDGKRLPDGLGARGFASVVCQAQAGARSFGVGAAKRFRAGSALIAAQSDADDGRIARAQLRGLAKDPIRLFNGEVANRVEDPVKRKVELPRARSRATKMGSKQRGSKLRHI